MAITYPYVMRFIDLDAEWRAAVLRATRACGLVSWEADGVVCVVLQSAADAYRLGRKTIDGGDEA